MRTTAPCLLLSASIVAAGAGPSAAEVIDLSIGTPLLDQWVYPFNDNPGNRFFMSVFSSQLPEGFSPLFDNRDGQGLVGFDLAPLVQSGLDPSEYTVLSARVTVRVQSNNTFAFDPTPDSYTTWLAPDDPEFTPDPDPGRALELFGAGFRNGFTLTTFQENTGYSPLGPFGKHTRNVFPIAPDSPREDGDVANNVDGRFDPTAMATGLIDGLAPGDLVPAGTDITFDLDVNSPDVHAYLQESLSAGRVLVLVASLFPAEQQGSGTFPRLFTKEDPAVVFGFEEASRLEMSVLVGAAKPIVGDVNGDGVVDGADLGTLLSTWGPCAGCATDLSGDGIVDGLDLGVLLSNWS